MSDYERYGDYNGAHDDDDKLYPPLMWVLILKKAIVTLLILIAVCVIGLLAVRMIFAAWYPSDMKELFPTEAVCEAYERDGSIEAITQELIVPYEDRKNGYFRADNLIVVKKSGSLQCSVRINRASYEGILADSGIAELSSDPAERFVFTLYYFFENGNEAVYHATIVKTESHFLYDYYKICFDGVALDEIPWYRLNIHIKGGSDTEKEPFACIVLYQNDEEYSTFTPFSLKGKEFFDD